MRKSMRFQITKILQNGDCDLRRIINGFPS
jgi:hypothetical protein